MQDLSEISFLRLALDKQPVVFWYIWEKFPDLFTQVHVAQLPLGERKSETKRLIGLNSRIASSEEREELDQEVISNIFNLIKDNEVAHLKQLLTPELIARVGYGQLQWNL